MAAEPPPYSPVDPLAPGVAAAAARSGGDDLPDGGAPTGPLTVEVAVGGLSLGWFKASHDEIAAPAPFKPLASVLARFSSKMECAWTGGKLRYGGAMLHFMFPSPTRVTGDLPQRMAAFVLASPPAASLRVVMKCVMMTFDDYGATIRLAARDPSKCWPGPANRLHIDFALSRLEQKLGERRPTAARLVFPPGVHDFVPAIPVGDRGLAEVLAELLALPSAKSAHWVDIDLVAAEDAAPGF